MRRYRTIEKCKSRAQGIRGPPAVRFMTQSTIMWSMDPGNKLAFLRKKVKISIIIRNGHLHYLG